MMYVLMHTFRAKGTLRRHVHFFIRLVIVLIWGFYVWMTTAPYSSPWTVKSSMF